VVIPIAYLIISIILLTLPGSSFPQEDWLDKLWFDKWVHLGMFSILVWLWCRGIKKYFTATPKLFLIIAICSLFYGIIMEFIQYFFIPYRSFDNGDIYADGAGCVLGFIFSVYRYIKK